MYFGAFRCGVVAPRSVLLAQEINEMPGLKFGGLMTSSARKSKSVFRGKARLIEGKGIAVEIVSIGGSQICGKWKNTIGTEYRIGTCYNDRSLMERKVCSEGDCALTVLATVVNTRFRGL